MAVKTRWPHNTVSHICWSKWGRHTRFHILEADNLHNNLKDFLEGSVEIELIQQLLEEEGSNGLTDSEEKVLMMLLRIVKIFNIFVEYFTFWPFKYKLHRYAIVTEVTRILLQWPFSCQCPIVCQVMSPLIMFYWYLLKVNFRW